MAFYSNSPLQVHLTTVTLLVLGVITLASAKPEDGNPGQAVVSMAIDDYADDYGLVCHHCYYSQHGDDCVTMNNISRIEKQICDDDQVYCKVEWLKTDDMLTTFVRGCVKDCQSGCVKAGDTYTLEKCFQCCKDDLCNEDSGSQNCHGLSRWIMVTVGLLSLFRILVREGV